MQELGGNLTEVAAAYRAFVVPHMCYELGQSLRQGLQLPARSDAFNLTVDRCESRLTLGNALT